ncbi:Alpha/Beta hydrolase protein [Hyaloraphidium curvatum]|nr:Alpha/Beta hydrolase protein [Hyaloraphidium curvatum]
MRRLLAYANVMRPSGAVPKRRARIHGSKARLPDGLGYATALVPRRKFDGDPLEGLEDPIQAEIVTSAGLEGVPKDEQIVVLNFHGGGHTVGDPTQVRPTNVEFAKLFKTAKCVAPTYRLAPAEKYPCALHDAVSAYLWLTETEGYPSSRIVVAGISAGGNIAESLVLYLLQNSLPLPRACILFTPTMDLTNSSPSRRTATSCILPGWPITSVPDDPPFLHPYSPSLAASTDPLVSPLFAKPDPRHPPTYLQTGDVDRLQDEVLIRFVQLATSGVPAACEIYGGGTHTVSNELRFNPQARRIHERAAAFVRGVFSGEAVGGTLSFVDGECNATDLEGLKGAREWLVRDLDEYAGHVEGGKERIRRAWEQNGYLKVWEAAVGSG